MVTRITNGKVLYRGEFQNMDIYLQDGKILPVGTCRSWDKTIDAQGNYVTAGFVDVHCHGGGGADFADGDYEGTVRAVQTHLRHGTTTIFPTMVSTDFDVLEKGICVVEKAQKELPSIGGIHLEGPYFSPAQTGAQNGKALRKPDEKEYGAILSRHKIDRWDYAPEMDEDFAFLNALLAAGTLPAAAHTDATCQQMEDAADRGCQLVTHLYSCTSTIRREAGFRIAGVVEATYLRDDISAELIADGCHLPHSLLRLAYKQKGADRLMLVTDAMRAAGLAQSGTFDIGGVPCVIEDGVAKLLDRSAFAGSIATTDRLVRTCYQAGIPLAESVKMMTETPAKKMGLPNKGLLEEGYDADIVIFDENIHVKTVILQGETVYEEAL